MDPAKLKVVELRAELSRRGLDSKGNKPVLVERLRKALEEEAEQEYQESSPVQAEDIDDTTLKETQERITEAARSSQSPRTPSRASRSSTSSVSPVVSPVKISTRNASKTASTPNSSKQFTPSKLQYVDKAHETYETMSESALVESVVQEAKILKSPEKFREEQEDYASNIVQNKIYSSPLAESQQGQAKHINILEDNKYEANVPQVPATQPSEKSSTIAYVDQFSITREEHETKGSNIHEVGTDQYPIGEIQDLSKLKEKTEVKGVDTIQSTFEKNIEEEISVEKENIKHVEDTYNVKDNIDIPEQSTHVKSQEDKTCDIELKNEEINVAKDYTMQSKQLNVSMESIDEKTDNIPQDEQEIEMTEVKKEIKLDTKESNQKECNDRKRNRSPSPVEVHQMSSTQEKAEDEPDFDESAIILSWYDSDLNLIINKQGFVSATPMHDSDFCHLWAGARASYGFINGKVYYEVKITEQHSKVAKDEKHSHILRVGWSVPHTSMQLGEAALSYTYTSAGQKGTDKKFTDYGSQFGKDDVVGCYLDMTSENTIELSYTVNGKDLGSAFSISKEELGDRPLFPHILSKNCTFVCNFGQEEAWHERIPEYTLVGQIELKDRIAGPRRPDNKVDCEVIMMCGLPAAGKTTWVRKHVAEHPDKLYNILALHNLVEKTGDVALSDKEQNSSRQQVIIDKCNRTLDQLIDVASVRRRNYILDQKSNVYSSVQRRKMRNFCGYQRKAVVVVPADEEYKQRLSTHSAIEGSASESTIMEMKANFTAPSVGESFNAVEWVGLDEAEGKKLIEKYNKEGKEAGFNQQPAAKRPRLEKTEVNRETRDSRNSRDHRRNNYQDRSRNPSWRGPNMGGWRGERPQRGYMRHAGGYGPPPAPWRPRGGRGLPMVRGPDRRVGNVDRRSGNDRNRSAVSRQGSWGPVSSNYQGTSQQSNWNQQDNWSGSGQSQGNWNQQGGWGQQQWGGGWKGYGQSTYSQGYNQQGYGNGNWSNWNQQYYNNQYWGQQQQSGQTTAAGSQAEITNEKVATPSTNAAAGYNYSQG